MYRAMIHLIIFLSLPFVLHPNMSLFKTNTYWVGLGRLFLWYLFIIIFVAKVMYDANRQGMIECNSLRLVLIRAPI